MTSQHKLRENPLKCIHVNNDENVWDIPHIKSHKIHTSTLEIYWNRWNFCQSTSQLQCIRLPQASKILIISRNFNFTFYVSIHATITCQGIFVSLPAFANYLSWLVQHIVFKQSRHRFVLAWYDWYYSNIFHTKTGSSSEALIFHSLFDSCVLFLCFSWLKDFLWFKYLVLNFVSDIP